MMWLSFRRAAVETVHATITTFLISQDICRNRRIKEDVEILSFFTKMLRRLQRRDFPFSSNDTKISLLQISLEIFLGLLFWTSTAKATDDSAAYSCKQPDIPVSFSLCGSYEGLDHGNQIGCDVVCMLLGKSAVDTISKAVAMESFYNWCLAARQPSAMTDITADEAELNYAEYIVLMAAVTPSCIRESLVVFDDVVSQNPYKSTEPDVISWVDLDTWLNIVFSFARNIQRQSRGSIDYTITKEDFKKYWNEKILARIAFEQINCNRTDLSSGLANNSNPTAPSMLLKLLLLLPIIFRMSLSG